MFRVFASYDRHLNKAKITFWCAVALLLTAGVVRFGWIPGITTDTLRIFLGHLVSAFGLLGVGILGITMWGVKVIVSRFEKLRIKARWIERLLLGMRPARNVRDALPRLTAAIARDRRQRGTTVPFLTIRE